MADILVLTGKKMLDVKKRVVTLEDHHQSVKNKTLACIWPCAKKKKEKKKDSGHPQLAQILDLLYFHIIFVYFC